jgi:hypothetical protein
VDGHKWLNLPYDTGPSSAPTRMPTPHR